MRAAVGRTGIITVCAPCNLSLHNLIGERLLIGFYLEQYVFKLLHRSSTVWFLVNDSRYFNAPQTNTKARLACHLASSSIPQLPWPEPRQPPHPRSFPAAGRLSITQILLALAGVHSRVSPLSRGDNLSTACRDLPPGKLHRWGGAGGGGDGTGSHLLAPAATPPLPEVTKRRGQRRQFQRS